MNHVCLINLAGIPAAGKTTFCRAFCELLQNDAARYNAVHIEFDSFVKISADEACSKKMYKQNRYRLRCLLRQFIDDIKSNGNIDKSLALARFEYTGCELRTVIHQNVVDYILLVDDNMFFKSMRKEIRSIAKELSIGHLILYFESSVDGAIARDSRRIERAHVGKDIILNMAEKFEPPQEADEGSIIHINIETCTSLPFDVILAGIRHSMHQPLVSDLKTNHSAAVEQSQLHKIDLFLRREISRIVASSPSLDDKKMLSAICCQKRKLILNDLRSGLLPIPDDFMEIKDLLIIT